MNSVKILSVPKKFEGHIGVIQENAIKSWIVLFGKDAICLFGDEETKAVAERCGVGYEEPERSSTGVPLLDSVLEKARTRFTNSYFLYINGDIILLSDFPKTISLLAGHFPKGFFLIGRRTNVDITEPIDFNNKETENTLRSLCREKGKLAAPTAIDYFLFPKESFMHIPPLRIGRACFDNILIYWAKKFEHIPVVDGTKNILAVHQNHTYSHVSGGIQEIYFGTDAEENLGFVSGKREKLFRLDESDYRVIDSYIEKNHRLTYYMSKRYIFEVFPSLYPIFLPLVYLRKKIARLSQSFK